MELNNVRPWAPPATESMDPWFLEEVVGSVFPGAVNDEESRRYKEQELQLLEEEPPGTTGS
jgi:hypothetical protein